MSLRRAICCFSAVLALAPEALAQDVKWRDDEAAHFGAAGCATAGTIKVLQAIDSEHDIRPWHRLLAGSLVLGISSLKEIGDMRRQGSMAESRHDMKWNTGGALIGNLLAWEF